MSIRRGQPTALVLEDSDDTRLILKTLAARRGFEVMESKDGAKGLALAKEHRPDLILLDLGMPGMSGIEVLEEIREYDASVPVVIISGSREGDLVEEALELGAVNFVHKPFDHQEIEFVLDQIYRATEEDTEIHRVLDFVGRRVTELSIPCDGSYLSKVVAYLGRELSNNYPGYELPLTEIKLALYESLANALEHGNLEITFEEKTKAMAAGDGIHGLLNERLKDPKLGERKIHIRAEYHQSHAYYAVRDEGPGFDPQALINRPVADTSALHGRGITLIRHYMDEVSWNDSGNEIRMQVHMRERHAPRDEDGADDTSGDDA